MGILQDIKNDFVDRLTGGNKNKIELRAQLLDGADTSGYLVLEPAGITFHPDIRAGEDGTLAISADEIIDLQVTGRDETHERFTLTRLLLFKELALAFPKRNQVQNTLLDILLSDNTRVSFYLEELSPQETWQKIAHIVNSYSAEEVQEAVYQPSLSEELERLTALYEEGALTEQEFSNAKQALLGDNTPS